MLIFKVNACFKPLTLALSCLIFLCTYADEPITTQLIPIEGFGTTVDAAMVNDAGESVYNIAADESLRFGENLFHRFGSFNLGENSVAFFVSDNFDISHTNIITAINSDQVSSIQGRISTQDFASADLYLLNPNGFVFSGAAQLDLSGSLHLGTTDNVEFANGEHFYFENVGNSLLTSAPPVSFGLLSSSVGDILISGVNLEIQSELSLTARDILVDNQSRVESLAGTTINAHELMINEQAEIKAASIDINTTDLLILNASKIKATEDNAAGISINSETADISGFVEVQLRFPPVTTIKKSTIESQSGLVVNARQLKITELGELKAISININASDLMLLSGGNVNTAQAGTNAGDISIHSNLVTISGFGVIPAPIAGAEEKRLESKLNSSIAGTEAARAGNINISGASTIVITDGGRIQATNSNTHVESRGGNINIEDTGSLVIENDASIINSTKGNGAGGSITIEAESVRVYSGGKISAKSDGAINREGSAGNITLKTEALRIEDSGFISSSSNASGNGGNITISSDFVSLNNSGSIASSSSGSGTSGNIKLNANHMSLYNSKITVSSESSTGGQISINANQLLHLDLGSEITTSVKTGTGNAGNISVEGLKLNSLVLLDNGSKILAGTEAGPAGNIIFNVQSVIKSENSEIAAKASDPEGTDGEIIFNSNEEIAGLTPLPEAFSDSTKLISSRCTNRTSDGSHFYVAERDGLAASPDALLAGYENSLGTQEISVNTKDPTRDQSRNTTVASITCY